MRTATRFVFGPRPHVSPSRGLRGRALVVIAVLLTSSAVSWGRAMPSDAGACRHRAADYEGGAGSKGPDPLLDRQWGLERVRAPEAWNKGATGRGAVIAIIDSGVDLRHPDLRKNLITGADFAANPGCPGPQDEEGHGTHVAGIAAAAMGNGIGVAGVAPDAKIMPIRAVAGNQDVDAVAEATAKGIAFAAHNGADVINMSFGTFLLIDSPTTGEIVADAIEQAWDMGVVLVAAAGNEAAMPCEYPSSDPIVLCVGAVDHEGNHSLYSNPLVKPDTTSTLSAPGGSLEANFDCASDEGVWSTVLPGPDYSCGTSGYISYVGTSMASPYVAGVAALLAGEGLGNEEIVQCLTRTAVNPHTGQRGQFDPIYGYGEVDAASAVGECT